MNILVACVVVAQIYFSNVVKGQSAPAPPTEEEIDAELYKTYQKEVCDRVPAFTGAGEVPAPAWTNVMSESKVLELAFINMAYGLNSDSVSHLKQVLGWKKTVIDTISLITKTTCKDDVISESFLNAAKNLYLYYLSKQPTTVSGNQTAPEEREAEWKEIIDSLSNCANSISAIEISTQCDIASTFEAKDGTSEPIEEVEERFDEEIEEAGNVGIDVIVDTVWWMFSTAYSRCYAYFYPNEDVILLFFQMFREDFLEQFLTRWRSAGPNTIHFPIIFGPYDFKASSENVRKCATAAFQYEGLTQRQLVRPVTVLVDNQAVRNFKLRP